MATNLIQSITLHDCLKLRRDVLWPQFSLQDCIEDEDEQAMHYGYIKNQEIISCLSVFYRTPIRYQIRKFATQTQYQNQGIGTLLFSTVLQKLINKQIQTVYLNARITALRFYEKFDFKVFDKEFSKKNVTFLPMELNLIEWNIKSKNSHNLN